MELLLFIEVFIHKMRFFQIFTKSKVIFFRFLSLILSFPYQTEQIFI